MNESNELMEQFVSDLLDKEIWNIWRNFFHDLMQGPTSLKLSFELIARNLPKLISCYRKEYFEAIGSSDIDGIDQGTLNFLENVSVNVKTVLDAHIWSIQLKRMQLIPLNKNTYPLSNCEMVKCINQAFTEFPAKILHNFSKSLSVPKIENFIFTGNFDVMKHILFNLLDVSFYGMRDVGIEVPDQLEIYLTKDKCYNYLHIKNIGKKVSAEDKLNIFTRSFATKMCRDGTTFALYFCRKAMLYFGGDIILNPDSPEGYVEFILKFPEVA